MFLVLSMFDFQLLQESQEPREERPVKRFDISSHYSGIWPTSVNK